jgi:site-specific recombinase XerC
VTGQTANKDFIHLRSVLKTVNSKKRLQIVLPNEKISLPETEPEERPPFSDDWIETRLLAPGALDGLNDQARAIFKVMMNTGLRLIEIASLTSEEICLDDPKEGGLSYVQVLPIGRELKTRRAKRRVPLLGVSLEALRAFPEGFSTYRGKSATLSMTLNKYL